LHVYDSFIQNNYLKQPILNLYVYHLNHLKLVYINLIELFQNITLYPMFLLFLFSGVFFILY